jgi:hypothetical protein
VTGGAGDAAVGVAFGVGLGRADEAAGLGDGDLTGALGLGLGGATEDSGRATPPGAVVVSITSGTAQRGLVGPPAAGAPGPPNAHTPPMTRTADIPLRKISSRTGNRER